MGGDYLAMNRNGTLQNTNIFAWVLNTYKDGTTAYFVCIFMNCLSNMH